MYQVHFYKDKHGHQPVKEYIDKLQEKSLKSKESRVKLKKIYEYIEILANNGTRAGEQYTKHIEGDIWELRPLNDRIFFFFWKEDTYVLLHSFLKKTNKTPKREINKAKSNMRDFLERSK